MAEQAQKALDNADKALQGIEGKEVEENLDDLESDLGSSIEDEKGEVASVTRSHTGDTQEELQVRT